MYKCNWIASIKMLSALNGKYLFVYLSEASPSVDCIWSDWTSSECSVSCGGGALTKTRTRSVVAQNGGQECIGPTILQNPCNNQNCPSKTFILLCFIFLWIKPVKSHQVLSMRYTHWFILVNCEWSEWANGVCSLTCGGGTMLKTRTKSVREKYGGVCNGDPTERVSCNQQNCPSKYSLLSAYNNILFIQKHDSTP